MGLGGLLMWTALINEMALKHHKKVCVMSGKHIVKDPILKNNPNVSFELTSDVLTLNIGLKICPERFTQKNWNVSQHTIQSRCEFFGYNNPEIKCFLYFTPREIKYIRKVVSELPKQFIIIEPHAKTTWCAQKQYPLNKWQNIVDSIYEYIPVIQMSLPGKKILNNVIDISDKIKSFRHAALILKWAKLFISTEGGLMHACKLHNKKCIIIYPPLFNPVLTKYDNVIDIWVKSDTHYNCFKERICHDCIKLMKQHDENIIINKLKELLKLN